MGGLLSGEHCINNKYGTNYVRTEACSIVKGPTKHGRGKIASNLSPFVIESIGVNVNGPFAHRISLNFEGFAGVNGEVLNHLNVRAILKPYVCC